MHFKVCQLLGGIRLVDENLRQKVGQAFEDGDYNKALELSRELDRQILLMVKQQLDIPYKGVDGK